MKHVEGWQRFFIFSKKKKKKSDVKGFFVEKYNRALSVDRCEIIESIWISCGYGAAGSWLK